MAKKYTPKHGGGTLHLWEKGQSGNPGGRPRMVREMGAKLKVVGYTKLEVTELAKTMMALHIAEVAKIYDCPTSTILEKTLAKAIHTSLKSGKLETIQYLLELAFGKAKQSVEIEHKDRTLPPDLTTVDAVEASRVYANIIGGD